MSDNYQRLDWVAMIYRLNSVGYKDAEIARLVGVDRQIISKVKNDCITHFKAWDQAIRMLDLYVDVVVIGHKMLDFPRFYENNEMAVPGTIDYEKIQKKFFENSDDR
jgi:hypothetical protein